MHLYQHQCHWIYTIKKRVPKKLKLFDTGAHAQSFNENMDEYEDLIHDFLESFIYPKINQDASSSSNVIPFHF